ncbi:MAG: hypothetical protein FJ292_02155 [Planctomycetes bacterium]|nr:hypothetical protein [Planctomycetota bacterium]
MHIHTSIVVAITVVTLPSVTCLADDVTIVTGQNTRLIASFDEATEEIEAIEIETRDASGGWVIDTFETADAQDVVEGESSNLTGNTGDCDGNGTPDWQDIANGAEDLDRDGQIDTCERARGDVNLNGVVNQNDLFYVLGLWDSPLVSFGDADQDGEISGGDLALVLLYFGT